MSTDRRKSTFPSGRSMSDRSRRSNTRRSSVRIKKGGFRKKTPRSKWKWAIRIVLHNLSWLADTTDVPLGDNTEHNAYITSHRKEGQILSLEDKLFFKKPREDRTQDSLQKVNDKLQYFKAFREYSPKVRDELLMRLNYVYYNAGRVIVRQGREAEAMYFIIIGSVEVDQYYPDPIFPKEYLHNINKFGYGDSFGEVPLFYGESHGATIAAIDAGVEMLMLYKSDFKIVLEDALSAHWGSIRWALSQFPYFNRWPEVAVRYLCSHSLLITTPSEVRVPVKDVNGLGIAAFVLEGTVKVIQRMLVRVNPNEEGIRKKFSLYSDQNCSADKLPENVVPIFMQTVKLRRNAVFGLGEILSKHMLITETDTLLMICPRFIIDRYNIINVWTRIVGILDSAYPKVEKIFDAFITNRSWAINRKKFAKSLNLPKADKNMTIHDTPVSSRATNCLMKDRMKAKIQSMPQYQEIIKQMKAVNSNKIRKSVKRSTIDEVIDELNVEGGVFEPTSRPSTTDK